MNVTGAPCLLCGVRPDVDCQHRPGRGKAPVHEYREDGRARPRPGAGFNFHGRRLPPGAIDLGALMGDVPTGGDERRK